MICTSGCPVNCSAILILQAPKITVGRHSQQQPIFKLLVNRETVVLVQELPDSRLRIVPLTPGPVMEAVISHILNDGVENHEIAATRHHRRIQAQLL